LGNTWRTLWELDGNTLGTEKKILLSHPSTPQKAKRQKRKSLLIRVIRKLKKTEHQNPEFGHTQGEIQKNTCIRVH
jgi:hypothetical protein